ncbi:MAG: MATE family efflux transporter [Eubacteriales bacterium]|nr:MATE family efflux transporter [Eubacteriales bacterium]
MRTLNADLLKDKILKALIIFALPLLISNIFQQFYNTVDTMIVGNVLGDTSLAAIGACGAIYELMIGFALGVGNGMSIVIARCYGAGNIKQLRKSVAGAIAAGIFMTLVIVLVSRIWMRSLLQLLDTPDNIIEKAYSYISLITGFAGVMFCYNLCAGILRAVGNSVMPLVFLVISSFLNIVLDYCFIKYMHTGIGGAAAATVIAQGVSAVLCIIYIIKTNKFLVPERKDFVFDAALYKELLLQGLSMGMMLSVVSAGTVILQKAINGFGHLVIAGHVTARKLNSFLLMPNATLATAMATFVSQNKGAGQRQRIKDGVKIAVGLGVCWAAAATGLVFLFGRDAVKLISGSSEPVVLDNAVLYLKINAPFYTALVGLAVLRNSMQGLGRKIIPLFSSIIELVGKILFVIFLIPKLGYLGVIICEPVIWCVMCAQLAFCFSVDKAFENTGA